MISPAPDAQPNRLSRRAYMLLGLLTITAFGGPVGIGAVLRGGARTDWPPDRLVEWVTLWATCAAVVALMFLAISVALANQRALRKARENRSRPDGDRA